MKKILTILLALTMVFALVACSGTDSSSSASTEASTDTADDTAAEASSAADDTAAEASSDTASGSDAASGDHTGEPMHITLITMDQMDVHWVKLEAAAQAEAEKLNSEGANIEFEWLAPERKDNAQQIQQIETAINNGADAIIISVNDSTACNDALQQALDQGIKLIYVDATADLKSDATFATDNYAAGAEAGEAMLGYLKDANITEGEIGIVSAQAGVQSCIDRVDGFISVFEGTPYTMSEVQYSDGDASKAQELANNLINDGCVALYAANDGATTGTANAVKEANSSGRNIICVGFDNSSANRDLIRDEALLAFMAQNPAVMGEKAVEAACDLLEGKSIPETNVDTGVSVVTASNVDDFND